MVHKLVFIEGVSGVGKTTASALICNKFCDLGVTSTCHLEGDCDNPLDPFKGTYPPSISFTAFAETYMSCWRQFAKTKIEQEQILILDGTFLHHQINDLIRNYSASDETIVAYLTGLLQIIQPMNPSIFYLVSRDVGQRLQIARESRGQPIPTDEKIAFWENRKRVDLLVLERLPIHTHVLQVDDGWDMVLQTMVEQIMNKPF